MYLLTGIFTADCLCHPIQVAGIETIYGSCTLLIIAHILMYMHIYKGSIIGFTDTGDMVPLATSMLFLMVMQRPSHSPEVSIYPVPLQ